MKDLAIVLEPTSAIAVFTSDAMDENLKKIENEVLSFVPDISTAKGRKEIASLAYKIAKSKTALDSAGKTLTADWKAKAKLVDASRKKAKDFLDILKEKVRKPLTEWEEAEKLKSEMARIKAEMEAAKAEALSMNNLFDREKILEEKERLAAEKEAEEFRLKEEARIAAENLEHERLLKEQAAEQARLAAEREAQAKIDEAKRLEAEAKFREEQIKRKAIEAENKANRDAEQAEASRLQAIEDARIAQENAVRETQEHARLEAERAEQERIDAEIEEQRKAQLLAADLNHRTNLNREALNCFIDSNIDTAMAKKIIGLIAKGKIKNITINY